MTATVADLPLLERRRIEAGVLIPLIRAFQAEFGEERVNQLAADTIRAIARAQGEAERQRRAIVSMDDIAERTQTGPLGEGSLTADIVEQTEDRYGFDVTRCQFHEMYNEMGAGDLGFLLSCNRDFAYFEALAPDVHFDRTQTRMQGAAFCDFRYRK
jgi:predicted ArsR family transcriptional regulator